MTPAAEPVGSKSSIVLIEDNPADVFLFEYALSKDGIRYQLNVCGDGQQAMEFIARVNSGGASRPDLLVLDLNLPVYSGLEVLKRIRESAALRTCPAVILTNSNGDRDRQAAEALGIDLFLQKPKNLDDFARITGPMKTILDRGAKELPDAEDKLS